MQARKDFDHNELSFFFDYNKETGLITWKHSVGKAKEGSIAGSVSQTGYRKITLKGRTFLAHRIAWSMHYKSPPPDVIDHINGKTDDNRIENLTDGTKCRNQRNQKKAHSRNMSSKFLGVSKFKGRWRAKIYSKGKYVFLGYFNTEDEAAQAYKKAKLELHGIDLLRN